MKNEDKLEMELDTVMPKNSDADALEDTQDDFTYDPKTTVIHYPEEPRRSSRIRKKSIRFATDAILALLKICSMGHYVDDSALTFDETMHGADAQKWREAMREEINHMEQWSVWKLVVPPQKCRAITCRWLFLKKCDETDRIERYRARFVARGFTKIAAVDYEELFSPVAKHSTVRIVLSIMTANNLEAIQFDVRTPFLYGDLSEELYM